MDRFERAHGLLDVDALRDSRVLVAGLGSGGSTVALELAKAGVGGFTLIDRDRLEEPNLIRHECDDRYVGCNKAAAVADLIAHRNPEAEIESIAADVFELGDRLGAAVAASDLVAVCTDVEPPKHLLNRLCLEASVPAVYAGVYARGVGGEVLRCGDGGGDPCYSCVTSVLKDTTELPADEAELDYGAIDGDGTLHGAPGLGLDVRLIAIIHAKACLHELTGESGGHNVVLFGMTPVEGLFPRPLASALLNVAPQAGCLACAPMRQPREVPS